MADDVVGRAWRYRKSERVVQHETRVEKIPKEIAEALQKVSVAVEVVARRQKAIETRQEELAQILDANRKLIDALMDQQQSQAIIVLREVREALERGKMALGGVDVA